jgi:hypothetical protein
MDVLVLFWLHNYTNDFNYDEKYIDAYLIVQEPFAGVASLQSCDFLCNNMKFAAWFIRIVL